MAILCMNEEISDRNMKYFLDDERNNMPLFKRRDEIRT